uniref:G_PROTEIN_RECEP_F1_2 domain-containing protein n=1 Tax=Macrostomum lignano TaxID=282301 RepID=A0A1I8H7D6_9PLAT
MNSSNISLLALNDSEVNGSCLADHFNAFEKRFILLTDVILSSLIFVMGLVLNSLSVLVLKRDIGKSSMSVLLLALSTFDTVFIGLSAPYIVVYMGLGVLVRDSAGVALPAVWYLGSAARTARNWIILIVALDRYTVVQNPFMSGRRSNPRRSRIYCISVSAASLLYNLPLLLEYTVVPHRCLPLNVSQAQPERLGQVYMLVYKKLMHFIFLSLGPVLWLLVFNALLIRSLLVASRIRATITREATRRTEDTKMLVVIIAVFVATELPGAVWQLLLDTNFEKGNWFYSYFYSIGSLLTLLNSAVNFFIYCVWSANFRRNMALALGRPPRRKKFQQPKPAAQRSLRFQTDEIRLEPMNNRKTEEAADEVELSDEPLGVTEEQKRRQLLLMRFE